MSSESNNFIDTNAELSETLPVIDFESYRRLYDDTDNFRRLGILSEEAFTSATRDPRTLWATHEGQYWPALTPLEYEDGYDSGRVQQLTGMTQVYLLSIPSSLMDSAELNRPDNFNPSDTAVIVESSSKEGTQTVSETSKLLISLGLNDIRTFNDERITDESLKSATMGLFEFSVSPRAGQELQLKSFKQAWAEIRANENIPEEIDDTFTGAVMYDGDSLKEDTKLVDDLWRISESGFGNILGRYHPVSMEESREFFEEHLFDQKTYTCVQYVDGKAACFGSLSEGIDNCEWLNPRSSAVVDIEERASAQGKSVLFFSEIISNGEKGASHSDGVIGLHLKISAATNKSYAVLFESTNLSRRYVPKLIGKGVVESPMELIEPIRLVDNLEYLYASSS